MAQALGDVKISNGSGIWDPQIEILWIEIMRTDRRFHSQKIKVRDSDPSHCLCWPRTALWEFKTSQGLVPFSRLMNSFQTALTPNPEKLYKYYSVTKQPKTCFWMCSPNAFKLRCQWSGNPSIETSRRAVLCDVPWGNTNRVVSNRVVSKGPLYPSKTKIIIFVAFWYDPVYMPLSTPWAKHPSCRCRRKRHTYGLWHTYPCPCPRQFVEQSRRTK